MAYKVIAGNKVLGPYTTQSEVTKAIQKARESDKFPGVQEWWVLETKEVVGPTTPRNTEVKEMAVISADQITNYEDYLDTRDILQRIKWLEDTTLEDGSEDNELLEDEAEELATLKALIEEVRKYSSEEPEDGIALIRDTYFHIYAQDVAEDMGFKLGAQAWPYCHIDWDAAAEALKMDYSPVDFDGVTYWVQS